MYNKKSAIIWVMIFILFGVVLISCDNSNYISVQGTSSQLELDTIRIGTHQYLHGYERGRHGVLLCHYEDCDNPVHQREHSDIQKAKVDTPRILLHYFSPN